MKTLKEKAILVSLEIKQWTARKFDRKVTEEVNEHHNAKDAGRFNKLLIASEHLQNITKAVTEIRDYHYTATLPWNNEGTRLLASELYFDYTAKIGQLKDKYEEAVSKFVTGYPAMIEEAKVKLNGLFNPDDYPSDVSDRFGIRTSFMPVPDSSDLRVNVGLEEVDRLKVDIAKEINDRFASAQRDIYVRVSEHLKRMHEKLSDKKGIFRDSLFNNLLEMVELLPKLNIAGDKNIAEVCEELRSLYCDPDTIRKNVRKRKETADQVNSILGKLNGLMA